MRTNVLLTLYVYGLSLVSIWVVYQGACDEPYFSLRRSDALVQVGVGVALIVLWLQFGVGVLVGVAKRWIPGWWLCLLLWVAVVLYYLQISPLGYLEDMERFVIGRR